MHYIVVERKLAKRPNKKLTTFWSLPPVEMYSSLGATATWNLFHAKLEVSEMFAKGLPVEYWSTCLQHWHIDYEWWYVWHKAALEWHPTFQCCRPSSWAHFARQQYKWLYQLIFPHLPSPLAVTRTGWLCNHCAAFTPWSPSSTWL
jgi:hypothetical protein